MASISSVILTLSPKVKVTVKLSFDASEAGKKFQLGIKLFGEDKPSDNLPAADAIGDDLIHEFKWGSKPFLVITAQAGTMTFSEERQLSSDSLDEDKGNAQTFPVPLMRADELYAEATLSSAPITARSATVVTPGW